MDLSSEPAGTTPAAPEPGTSELVTVYWRPSCAYCSKLRRELRKIGLETSEVNIWDVSSAADTVRAIAGGNETVPTVVVGDMALVNPSVSAILGALQIVAPFHINDRMFAAERSRWRIRTAQWVAISVLIGASLLVDGTGSPRLSWLIDGFAAALYLGFRIFRSHRFRRPSP